MPTPNRPKSVIIRSAIAQFRICQRENIHGHNRRNSNKVFLEGKSPEEQRQIREIWRIVSIKIAQQKAQEKKNQQVSEEYQTRLLRVFDYYHGWEIITAKNPRLRQLIEATRKYYEYHEEVPTIQQLVSSTNMTKRQILHLINRLYEQAGFIRLRRRSTQGKTRAKPIQSDKR